MDFSIIILCIQIAFYVLLLAGAWYVFVPFGKRSKGATPPKPIEQNINAHSHPLTDQVGHFWDGPLALPMAQHPKDLDRFRLELLDREPGAMVFQNTQISTLTFPLFFIALPQPAKSYPIIPIDWNTHAWLRSVEAQTLRAILKASELENTTPPKHLQTPSANGSMRL